MPRLPSSILLQAYHENPLLPLLLKECRSLSSARNELRWLRERALRDDPAPQARQNQTHRRARRATSHKKPGDKLGVVSWRTRLRWMCHQRARGVPLQYILGDQPFGDLEILCRRGVLIPRSDTECYTYEAARLVRQMAIASDRDNGKDNTAAAAAPAAMSSSPTSTSRSAIAIDRTTRTSSPPSPSPSPLPSPLAAAAVPPPRLQILDLCTGTGCIALLLHALLAPHFQLQITGIDISPTALDLANRNLEHNIQLGLLDERARTEVRFLRGDVLGRGVRSTGRSTTGKSATTGSNGKSTSTSASTNANVNASTRTAPTLGDILFQQDQFQDPRDDGATMAPHLPQIDLLISNPPYISAADFRNGTTARSVRLFEPRLALVPPTQIDVDVSGTGNGARNSTKRTSTRIHSTGMEIPENKGKDKPEDVFYRRILEISFDLRARITVVECGDRRQADRVVAMFWGMREEFSLKGGSGRGGRGEGGGEAEGDDEFTVEVWPEKEEDLMANGFHERDGSRCVIIRRGL